MKVMKSKVTDQSAEGQKVEGAGGAMEKPHHKKVKKFRSKVPGVMITQYVEEIPEGKSHPDFTRKPIALTIQEGKFGVFKAIVYGEPTPTVTWNRANGKIDDPVKFQSKYDEASGEHTLEIPKVCAEDADTYKCFATNEYGKAVCTIQLNVIEVGFKKTKELAKSKEEQEAVKPGSFRTMLKKRGDVHEQKPLESEEKVWEILMSADKKDYEQICAEYGITNFRGMLTKLAEMKKEREVEQAQFIEHISSLKHIEVNADENATFEIDMDLKDASSRIFLYKDGVMVPYTVEMEEEMKHQLKRVGKKFIFTIKNLDPEDAGLYSVDVEGVNIFSTDFKIPPVNFAVKIQEVKAEERQDAIFQCVLTAPMAEINWMGKSAPIENDDKFEITVSEDKLIHKLLVKDCQPLDAGIYAAVAGIHSCNAWLVVEVDKNPANKGKKIARKTTQAGGGDLDLEKIAKEQAEKHKKDMEERLAEAKIKAAERGVTDAATQAEKEAADAASKAAREAARAAEAKAKAKAEKKAAKLKDAKEKAKAKKKASGGGAAGGGAAGAGAAGAGAAGAGAAGVGSAGVGAAGVGAAGGGAAGGGAAGGGAAGGGAAGGGAAGGGAEGDAGSGSEYDDIVVSTDESDEEDGAKKTKRVRSGQVVPDTFIDDDEEASSEQSGKRGKRTRQGPLLKEEIVGKTNSNGTAKDAKVQKRKTKSGGGAGAAGPANGGASANNGEAASGDEASSADEANEPAEAAKRGKRTGRTRPGPILQETIIDPGVHFNLGLSDVTAILGDPAELVCKLSKENVDGVWYLNGDEIQPDDVLTMSKDGFFQSLKISKISEDYAGKYKFEADGRKTEAMIVVEDPPRFDTEELKKFTVPIITKKGQKATFKIPFVGRDPMKIQWYHDGEELSDDTNIKIEHGEGYSQLTLNKLQRKDTGEIKFKLKNEFGTVEAFAKIIVTDKPTPPLGPLEIIEASQNAIEVKWRSPKDDGGCKILNYILERQQIGRNTWKKLGPIGPEAHYKDSDVDHGRRYCYKIRADTEMGSSELMETEDVQAGTKAYAGPPSAPKVVSAFKDCITLTWNPPSNTGGTNILGYNMEKRKKGSNLWSPVNPADDKIKEKEFGVKDVIEGMEYEFRVAAINNSGAGEFGTPSEFVFARDPKKPPGKVIDLKVTDSTYTTLSLGWTKPKEKAGVEDEAKGFFVEIRPAESPEWDRCNNNPSTMTSFTVKGMKSMAMYWVRVIATNDGGEGKPQELDNYILAMPPPVRPRFTDQKVKSFMVVQAGNSARFNMNFEASPWPDVTWMKDGMPVSKRVTISNAEGASQLLIPSSERSDTGIYTIMVKNIVGQETFSIEIRVTDEPKPPGPVEVDENVPGTVTISWSPSPDEKRDDRLHYLVSKRDSSKRTWHTVADHIFNNKFTACNIMPGREYQFRVYAKNDMGSSQPSESPKWEITGKKERFVLDRPETKTCNLERPPKFLVPLKMHTAPQGYECYMSCAVRGDPTPHVTWYRNNISLNTNTNYLISNTCGVCSMLILRVGPKDTGEYKIIAENNLGRAECSTKLTVSD
ncbi:immunoglobulin-like and fibronectin type III domain-containing protein 1.1 isoform X2 [Oncorhynchus kisutch]|uniref:immunoglobulin-like and fibronectin type III domain-containing protein 1.1 isoform X2 n=1 Tax=Oncorhynchus kisutch TaxID=8019 RepID=UPI0009A00030|nr:immunoglobulin-like and fibronectin type III domain-containing protein 1 isoform X2 [Oncorhynchus kisutch]